MISVIFFRSDSFRLLLASSSLIIPIYSINLKILKKCFPASGKTHVTAIRFHTLRLYFHKISHLSLAQNIPSRYNIRLLLGRTHPHGSRMMCSLALELCAVVVSDSSPAKLFINSPLAPAFSTSKHPSRVQHSSSSSSRRPPQ